MTNKYSLTGDYTRGGGYVLFEISEKVIENEAFGDQIGVCSTDNILWVYEDIDINDEVEEFLTDYFLRPIDTYRTIVRYL